MTTTVIVPTHNSQNQLHILLDSLVNQTVRPDEIIVVDDYSTDSTRDVARRYNVVLVENKGRRGPASARNLGIKNSKGGILVFIDSDCKADARWVENINKEFSNPGERALMGRLVIPSSSILGDSISALGYPAGGSLGFDKMWHVDADGKTDHISSANFAIRKETVAKVGLFDETFPYAGCEDVEFSVRCVAAAVPIHYSPDIIVIHPPRKDMASFIRWQIIRGKSNYHLKKKLKHIGGFIKLRIWSTKNMIKRYMLDPKLPLILVLFVMAYALQCLGYLYERCDHNGHII